jgi:hypothetical protein
MQQWTNQTNTTLVVLLRARETILARWLIGARPQQAVIPRRSTIWASLMLGAAASIEARQRPVVGGLRPQPMVTLRHQKFSPTPAVLVSKIH